MGPECHVIGVFIRGKETQRQTRDGKTMQAHRANAVEAEVCRDASTRQGKPRSATTTTTSRKRPEASPLWGLPRGRGPTSTSTLHRWPPEPDFYCGKHLVCGAPWRRPQGTNTAPLGLPAPPPAPRSVMTPPQPPPSQGFSSQFPNH